MKKIIIVPLLLFAMLLNAQTENKYLLRTSIGYNYHHQDRMDANSGVATSGMFGKISQGFSWDVDAGRKLGKQFYIGLGFGLNSSRVEINPDEDVPDPDSPSGYGTYYYLIYQSVSRSNSYSPRIYFQYFYNISERFTISLDLYTSYTYLAEKVDDNLVTYQLLDSVLVPNEDKSYSEHKKQYLGFGISPSLRFSIIRNFGMEAVFGTMEYRMKFSDSRAQGNEASTKDFMFMFTPENWRIGFFLKL